MFTFAFGATAVFFLWPFLGAHLDFPEPEGLGLIRTAIYVAAAYFSFMIKICVTGILTMLAGMLGYGIDRAIMAVLRRAWNWLTLADIPSREYRAFYKQAEEEFDSDQRVASVYETAQLRAVFDDAKTKRFYCEARATDLTARASALQRASNT